MKIIQIILRCKKDRDHAKIFRLDANVGMGLAETLAALLDGSSHLYIYPPGDQSPIGLCAVCGGGLTSEISERVTKDDQERFIPKSATKMDVFGDAITS